MRVRLDKILQAHEADDADYFRSEHGIRERIKQEFLNADEMLEALKDEDFRRTVFDYSVCEPSVNYPHTLTAIKSVLLFNGYRLVAYIHNESLLRVNSSKIFFTLEDSLRFGEYM